MSSTSEPIRDYWNIDAATYDHAASHNPQTALELAAWRGTLRALLPAPPAQVLDVGAGTGFLSLLLAELGYQVTALDFALAMLDRLRGKATDRGLQIDTIEGDAQHPPIPDGDGGFDAVIERHVLWTLPDPAGALEAWRQAAPRGRLLLVESLWGSAADPVEALRSQARTVLRRLRRTPSDHHAEYDQAMRERLPLGSGTKPDELLRLVAASSWGTPRLHRLIDIEWATRATLSMPERLLGVTPRYAIQAGV